ncbi:MAG: erythromycin esterase family protein [Planctomycetota bacterium]
MNIGTTFGKGKESGWPHYQVSVSRPSQPGSLDYALSQVGLPLFVIDLRTLPNNGPAYRWLNQLRGMRWSQPEDIPLVPVEAWDILLHVQGISPAHKE